MRVVAVIKNVGKKGNITKKGMEKKRKEKRHELNEKNRRRRKIEKIEGNKRRMFSYLTSPVLNHKKDKKAMERKAKEAKKQRKRKQKKSFSYPTRP